MAKEKTIEEQIAEAKKQIAVWEHREQRLKNRENYYRSAKDRKRTHRLILYGAGLEAHHKELSCLSDVEVYKLMESLLEIPEVNERIAAAVAGHTAGDQEGGE